MLSKIIETFKPFPWEFGSKCVDFNSAGCLRELTQEYEVMPFPSIL